MVIGNETKAKQNLLTKEQAAGLLNISSQTLLRMVKAGNIRSIKLSPKCVRFTEEDVLNYSKTVQQ